MKHGQADRHHECRWQRPRAERQPSLAAVEQHAISPGRLAAAAADAVSAAGWNNFVTFLSDIFVIFFVIFYRFCVSSKNVFKQNCTMRKFQPKISTPKKSLKKQKVYVELPTQHMETKSLTTGLRKTAP